MILRTVLILHILVMITSVSSAEVYKWEDANGMHYTDSPGSVPEKFREKVYAETREQIRTTTPKARAGVPKLNIEPVVNQINQVPVYLNSLEQQRQASEAMRQQQARSLAVNNKNLDDALQPLARVMAKWLLIGFVLFVVWVATIIDIVRSDFTSPSNKTVWMLLVILIPLLGMLLYYLFGLSQKCSSTNSATYDDKDQKELLARLRPRDPNAKDFVIK